MYGIGVASYGRDQESGLRPKCHEASAPRTGSKASLPGGLCLVGDFIATRHPVAPGVRQDSSGDQM